MNQLFTQEDAWNGGFYLLVLELPEPSVVGVKNALAQLQMFFGVTFQPAVVG